MCIHQQDLTCWATLTDATLADGCLQAGRGRHVQGTLRRDYVELLGWECFEDPDLVAVAAMGARERGRSFRSFVAAAACRRSLGTPDPAQRNFGKNVPVRPALFVGTGTP